MKHNYYSSQDFQCSAFMHLSSKFFFARLQTARSFLVAMAFVSYSCSCIAGEPIPTLRPEISDFIVDMANRHKFDSHKLKTVFNQARFQPDIIRLISAPASTISWNEYRERFVNMQRIKGGIDFWNKYSRELERAKKVYGVPEEIIVAIIGVETSYGASTGNHRVIDALTTLAFDFPRRADYFREELEHYLLLAREQNFDLLSIKGSYAGAIGVPQFMPGSYRRYAVDFDGDGIIDLSGNAVDAIGSVGNYLKTYGWQPNEPVAIRAQAKTDNFQEFLDAGIEPLYSIKKLREAGIIPLDPVENDSLAAFIELNNQGKRQFWLGFRNFYVITRYNRSTFYAMSVFELAKAIRAGKYAGRKR